MSTSMYILQGYLEIFGAVGFSVLLVMILSVKAQPSLTEIVRCYCGSTIPRAFKYTAASVNWGVLLVGVLITRSLLLWCPSSGRKVEPHNPPQTPSSLRGGLSS